MSKARNAARRIRLTFGVDGGAPFVALSEAGETLRVERGAKGGDLLSLLDVALKAEKALVDDVVGIVVDLAPDGFSSVRRRAAMASSLASALGVPLARAESIAPDEAARLPEDAFTADAAVAPGYDRAPNITAAKRPSPLKRT